MLLSLTLLATVAGIVPPVAPTVDAASAELRGGTLAVQVETSGPVASTDVRTKILAHSFVVYLGGARVRPDRIHLGTEIQAVVAYSRLTYAKLEVPLHAGLGCAGPVSVTTGPDWVRAEIGCARGPSATDQKPTESRSAPEGRPTLAPPPPKAKIETKTETKIETAPLAVPLPAARPQALTPVLLRVSPLPAPGPAVPAPTAAAPAMTSPTAAPETGGHSGLIACLLLLLAGAAFGLWKRRSAPLDRRIRILETASLGPKRALILAEINGVTMVIGSSEAGISLLTAPTPATNDGAIPSNEAAADEGDSTFGGRAASHSLAQSGALHRLFPKIGSEPAASEAEAGERAEDALFASMLAETMEDQELRQRLSNGFSGKTS
jgi:flagellar biogenesis protein FliO